jgi:hypothetical protein
MRQVTSFVGIGMEVITRKLVAIAAKFYALVMGAFIGRTTMRFTENMLLQWYLAIMAATSITKHYFNRNIVFLRQFFNCVHCLLVLMGQEEMTIEAVQTARGSHLKIVHIFLLSGTTLFI